MTARKRVAVFDLYWTTYGGGEQVAGAIAQVLSHDHDVTLLGPEPIDVEAMKARLGVDLSGCAYLRVDDDRTASAASADFDLFINTTYASSTVNLAPAGLYYVHFPGPPGTSSQRARRTIARVLANTLRRFRFGRLSAVHAGLERRTQRTTWTSSYTMFLSNSTFTAEWVTRLWKVPSSTLYPPVRPEVLAGTKSQTIASVGRFFEPKFGHSKKQRELLHAFIELERQGNDGWRLELVGGADASSRDYALLIRREALGHEVGVHFNAPLALLHKTLAAASIFWHGGGYGENASTHPERFEHFGIAVVEAMAAGAVPVVFGAAGPAEIVRDGVDGFHWHEPAELVRLTQALIADPAKLATMSANAQKRARDFSADRFSKVLRDAVAQALS